VHTDVHTCTQTYTHARTHAHSFAHRCTHRRIHAYTHTHSHTTTQPCNAHRHAKHTHTRKLTAINEVRTRGESCGGEVTCIVRSCPKGVGTPIFSKLEAELALAMMSLPATKVRVPVCVIACVRVRHSLVSFYLLVCKCNRRTHTRAHNYTCARTHTHTHTGL
jgi:hypothetical protein